jgi:ubiquinone/menaquinone biosynthesis C-methylase UbiE
MADYVPALAYRSLTRLYDPLLRLTFPDRAVKRALVDQAHLESGMRVLDVGCGTATLTIMIAGACPGLEVTGLDGDPDVLRIAKEKARAAGVAVNLVQGVAMALPFEDASFDRVTTSLVLHHLTPENKLLALREMRRVLRPEGELHIADWGKPHGPVMRAAFLGVQLLDGFATTRDHAAGRLPSFVSDAGFEAVTEMRRSRTIYGTLVFLRALRPKH